MLYSCTYHLEVQNFVSVVFASIRRKHQIMQSAVLHCKSQWVCTPFFRLSICSVNRSVKHTVCDVYNTLNIMVEFLKVGHCDSKLCVYLWFWLAIGVVYHYYSIATVHFSIFLSAAYSTCTTVTFNQWWREAFRRVAWQELSLNSILKILKVTHSYSLWPLGLDIMFESWDGCKKYIISEIKKRQALAENFLRVLHFTGQNRYQADSYRNCVNIQQLWTVSGDSCSFICISSLFWNLI